MLCRVQLWCMSEWGQLTEVKLFILFWTSRNSLRGPSSFPDHTLGTSLQAKATNAASYVPHKSDVWLQQLLTKSLSGSLTERPNPRSSYWTQSLSNRCQVCTSNLTVVYCRCCQKCQEGQCVVYIYPIFFFHIRGMWSLATTCWDLNVSFLTELLLYVEAEMVPNLSAQVALWLTSLKSLIQAGEKDHMVTVEQCYTAFQFQWNVWALGLKWEGTIKAIFLQ